MVNNGERDDQAVDGMGYPIFRQTHMLKRWEVRNDEAMGMDRDINNAGCPWNITGRSSISMSKFNEIYPVIGAWTSSINRGYVHPYRKS